jgi:replicative DNA helicase
MSNRVDPQIESLRVPPHSIEAEQSVLGGLLLDNAAWDKIADMVSADDFYRFDHRLIFQHIVKLINASRPADVITVFDSLTSAAKAEDAGGITYLNALAQNTPSAANIRRYAEIVRDRGVLRKLITVSDEITSAAFNPQGKEVKQMLDEAESKIFSIAEEGARGSQGFQEIQPLLTQVVDQVGHVGHQIQHDVGGCCEQNNTLNHCIISIENCVKNEFAKTGNGKHLFR